MAIYIPKGWKDYLSNGWSAESSKNAGFLALSMHKISSQMGIQANILNAPMRAWEWDKLLQFSGVRIEFKNQDHGCSLKVVITNEEKIERGFFGIWKYFVDKNIFWGGPYRKDLTTNSKEKDIKSETSQKDAGEKKQIPPMYANDLLQVEKLSMEGLTIIEMATRLSRSVSTIKRYRKTLGIRRRKK